MSQFILIYGPGAIIESKNGPRVILRPDLGMFNEYTKYDPNNFILSDIRMSKGLLDNSSIFYLPSNAELKRSYNHYVYRTKIFPNWRLCINNKRHDGNFSVLYNPAISTFPICPKCGPEMKEHQEPIRFIVACPAGHMDDINWHYLVHRQKNLTCRHVKWFKWLGGGGSLDEIIIECPDCHANESMGNSYGLPWPCTARFPENELPSSPPVTKLNSCKKKNAWIIQRQASNLRIPELTTLLTIPPRHTNLHNLLNLRPIENAITGFSFAGKKLTKEILENILNDLGRKNQIKKNTIINILAHEMEYIQEVIEDNNNQAPNSFNDLILEEFHAFIKYSSKKDGIKPYSDHRRSDKVLFNIEPNSLQKIPLTKSHTLKIIPVTTLRTVTVQTGYRRDVHPDTERNPTQADIVPVSFFQDDNKWYPGTQYLGEGLFIMLDENDGWHPDDIITRMNGKEWYKSFTQPSTYNTSNIQIFRSNLHEELFPTFVWWHTLSHLIIRSLSIEAGYSSASIRERIFLEIDGSKARGGIILYSTQPGTEGTLGGMIALVPYFGKIINRVKDMLTSCSRDPLCLDNEFREGMYNGSACHGCVLLSETSCEHRNMWLDRNVLMEDLRI